LGTYLCLGPNLPMQILSLTLKNFKAHADRQFEFQAGTNAICGENGAGKTSILEAIAWVLFNYQGDYAKEDLIRNGSGSAQATVTFISSHDQRTYQVQRCTQRGYALFDPQLDCRLPYSRLRDEVLPWLRQHLGVGPGTDLAQLFARTLGVPQGTFTADFLQTAERRKAVFDAVLKVEDYTTAYKQMNALRRYAEGQVEQLKLQMQDYDTALADLPALTTSHQQLTTDVQQGERQLQALTQQLEALQQQRQQVQQQALQVQTWTAQRQQLEAKIASQQQLATHLQTQIHQAQQAETICAAETASYQQFQAAEAALAQLQQQLQLRQSLQHQHSQIQRSQQHQQTNLTRVALQLEAMAETAAELAALEPQVAHQSELEAQISRLQQEQRQLQDQQGQLQRCQGQLAGITQQLVALQTDIDHRQTLAPQAEAIADLEAQRDRIQQQLSRLEAARQFQQELEALADQGQAALAQHRPQVALALAHIDELQTAVALADQDTLEALRRTLRAGAAIGADLVGQVGAILQDLAPQTNAAALQRQRTELQRQLEASYQARGACQHIPALKQRHAALSHQQQELQQQADTLTTTLQRLPQLETTLAALQQQLADGGNPRDRQQRLRQTLERRPALEAEQRQLTAAQAEQQQALDTLTQQIQDLAHLDADLSHHQAQKAAAQGGYTRYLQHQQQAQRLDSLLQQHQQQTAQQNELNQQLAAATAAQAEAQAQYNPAQTAQIEADYDRCRSEVDQLQGRLPEQRARQGDLSQRIAGLQATAERRDRAQTQLKQRERVRRFVNFARRAYKEAGPRITEQYVQAISRQADRLFRDLINRPDASLSWTKDYDIVVQDGPHPRRFVNLSGGEQMCAALAVRLALLKTLADIDVAFFDEPTTNMDRPRREGLADAISRIRSFRQLFVISHDDTFEQVTEHVITVQRDG